MSNPSNILTKNRPISPGKLISPDGKTPIASQPRTVVWIRILHQGAGVQAKPQAIDVLKAEVDGDYGLIASVLKQSIQKCLQILVRLGVISSGPLT